MSTEVRTGHPGSGDGEDLDYFDVFSKNHVLETFLRLWTPTLSCGEIAKHNNSLTITSPS